jgi:UDP-N-acetylmuramoyl-tripeptide--D-alanyl-D-alanine ligase
VHTVLRAAAAGLAEDLTWSEIINGLMQGHTQLRLVAVHTNNGALILDDTYNASPESTLAALNLLSELEGRKIAVLGDMLELGPYERRGHEMVGVRAAEVASVLITVGERGKMIAEAAQQSGLPANAVQWYGDVTQAAEALNQILREGDVALVKGSHGLHMERIVNALEVES